MDFTWTKDEDALRAELKSYIEDHLRPTWTHTDRDMPTQATVDEVISVLPGPGRARPAHPGLAGRATAAAMPRCGSRP